MDMLPVYVDGSEIIGLSLRGIKFESDRKYFVKDHEIHTILSHGNHVWATSIQAGQKGSLLKFDGNKKEEYIEVPMKCKVVNNYNQTCATVRTLNYLY